MAAKERVSAYVVIPSWVYFYPKLPDKSRLLYGLISSMCNHKGYCWARNETLMGYLGECSERTLQRHLKSLQDIGAIRVEEGQGGSGVQRKIYITDVPHNPDKNDGVNPDKNDGVNPDKNDGVTPSKMSPRIITNNNTPIVPKGDKSNDPMDDPLFEEFWNEYGYKVKRKTAERAWNKLHVSDHPGLFDAIMAGLARAKASRQWQDGYAPHPSTWLNGERWKDEIPDAPQPMTTANQTTPELGKAEPKVEVWA